MDTPLNTILQQQKGNTVITVQDNCSIFDCVNTMNEHYIGAVLVLDDDGQLVGVFTERDTLRKIVAKDIDPHANTVSQFMTRSPFTVSPNTTVGEAMHLMTDKRVRHLPVVASGKIVGLISIGDLTRWLVERQHQEITELVNYIQR